MNKGKENEQVARAKQEFQNRDDVVVADRMLRTLSMGDIQPGNWRFYGDKNAAGGMGAKYDRPWDLPPQQFQDMISYQEGLSDSDLARLNKDYEILHGNAHGNIDRAIQKSALQQVYENDSKNWSSAADNNEFNRDYRPEGGY